MTSFWKVAPPSGLIGNPAGRSWIIGGSYLQEKLVACRMDGIFYFLCRTFGRIQGHEPKSAVASGLRTIRLLLMSVSDFIADTSQPENHLPENLGEAGFYRAAQEGFEHSLVVLALGYVCWLMPAEGGFRLLVESAGLERVRTELWKYDRESVDWPPLVKPDQPTLTHWDFFTPLLWTLIVIAVFRFQWSHPAWIAAGALDSNAIFKRGEWWRGLTALFLHEDAVHLVSNLCFGVVFFSAVLSGFGRARGWLLIAVAAVAGNLAVAALRYPGEYRSIGASTAIFAALGLLTGRSVRHAAKAKHPHRARILFIPAAAGLMMLALYGVGGPTVDVLAHFSGFCFGAVLGFIADRPKSAAD